MRYDALEGDSLDLQEALNVFFPTSTAISLGKLILKVNGLDPSMC